MEEDPLITVTCVLSERVQMDIIDRLRLRRCNVTMATTTGDIMEDLKRNIQQLSLLQPFTTSCNSKGTVHYFQQSVCESHHALLDQVSRNVIL